MGKVKLASFISSFSVYTEKRLIAILFLGFSSGLPLALVLGTLSAWLSQEGVSRTAIGLFAIASTPYTFKFLWSPLVDSVRIPFLCNLLGRRVGWMVFVQIFLAISIFITGFTSPAVDPWWTALCAVAISFFSATQDIIIDAYRVELLDEEEQGAGAAMAVSGYRIGMLVSGAGALFLANEFGWQFTYVFMSALVFIGVITVLLSGEPKRDKEISDKIIEQESYSLMKRIEEAVVGPLLEFMQRQNWILILLFVIAYKFGDAFAGVMTTPFFIEMGFSLPEIASVNKVFGFAAVMIGIFIGGFIVKYLGLIRSLWVCGLLQMFTNFMFVELARSGYDMNLFIITIALENLAGGMGTAAFVAYLSSLCNVQYTATQYALLSSLAAVGRTWLSASSGAVVDSIGWEFFFISTVFAAIPGLLLLHILSKKLSAR